MNRRKRAKIYDALGVPHQDGEIVHKYMVTFTAAKTNSTCIYVEGLDVFDAANNALVETLISKAYITSIIRTSE